MGEPEALQTEDIAAVSARAVAGVAEVSVVPTIARTTPLALAEEKHRGWFIVALLAVEVLKLLGVWLLIVLRGLTMDEAVKFAAIDRGLTEYVLVGAVAFYFGALTSNSDAPRPRQ